MDREETFRNLVRGLIERGIFPSPSAINELRGKRGKANTLGTDHTRWRREELERAGFRRFDPMSKALKNPHNGSNPRYAHPEFVIVGGTLRRREHARPEHSREA